MAPSLFDRETPTLGVDPSVSREVLELLLTSGTWLHRRIESLVLVDETTATRSVSVDLALPKPSPRDQGLGPVVPIAFLRKRNLVHFDLFDERGGAVPLLTKSQNAQLSAAALMQLAYLNRPDLMDSLIDLYLPRLVSASEEEGAARELAWARIFTDRNTVCRHLAGRPVLVGLARDLAHYFVAYAAIDVQAGERRVLKFRYEVPLEPTHRGTRAFFGWRPISYSSGELAVGQSASYHVEIEAPGDTEFTYAGLSYSGGPLVNIQEGCARRAHIYLEEATRGTVVEAWFATRARRAGLLRAALLATLFNALVLGVIRARLSQFEAASVGMRNLAHPDTGSDAVAALLVSLPAILATYISRPGEHALVGRVLLGVRLLVVLSAAISFWCALSLFAGLSASTLKYIWTAAVAGQVLIFIAVGTSYVLPRPVRRP